MKLRHIISLLFPLWILTLLLEIGNVQAMSNAISFLIEVLIALIGIFNK